MEVLFLVKTIGTNCATLDSLIQRFLHRSSVVSCIPMHAHLPPYSFQNNGVQENEEESLDKPATENVRTLEGANLSMMSISFSAGLQYKVFNYIIDRKTLVLLLVTKT